MKTFTFYLRGVIFLKVVSLLNFIIFNKLTVRYFVKNIAQAIAARSSPVAQGSRDGRARRKVFRWEKIYSGSCRNSREPSLFSSERVLKMERSSFDEIKVVKTKNPPIG